MGTSGSKPDPGRNSPLIPPWADQDPPRPAPPPPSPDEPDPPPNPPPNPPPPPPNALAADARYRDFRVAYGQFARSGDVQSARRALGHYARTSTGGGTTASNRAARAARSGGAALSAFAGAANAAAPPPPGFDIRTLAGQPVASAIARIVDEFCPPGLLDEEMARLAVGQALAEALAGADTFDPNAINANAVRVAALAFVAELVFLGVANASGDALAGVAPQSAVAREERMRGLIREVVDAIGTPILAAANNALTPTALSGLVSNLVTRVIRELEAWQ